MVPPATNGQPPTSNSPPVRGNKEADLKYALKMNEKNFKIFVDFDGTITKTDVGEAFFLKFGDKAKVERIIDNLLSDRISARESWLQLSETVSGFSRAKFDEFIECMEIDDTFSAFVEYCSSKNYDMYVLSDGFDYYIYRIFKREKLENLKVYCNSLKIDKSNRLIPSFPFYDMNCSSSANCKRNHIISHSSDEDYTVFIGDGNSDKYTAQFCDFIFAKDDLLKYCERERITYFPFKNFTDVMERIEQLRKKKRLKKRHQAVLKRREAYMTE